MEPPTLGAPNERSLPKGNKGLGFIRPSENRMSPECRGTSRQSPPYLARLKVHQPEEMEASSVHLTTLQDLRRVVACDVLRLMDASEQSDSSMLVTPVEQESQSNS